MVAGEKKPVRDLSRPVEGDPGLFGPDSVTWRVHGDSSMFVGGLRALLLQLLHPLAMAGVAEHSDYRRHPDRRLARTAVFVATTTYGTTEEAEAAFAMVRRVHETVVGTAPDGRPYAANDPHLVALGAPRRGRQLPAGLPALRLRPALPRRRRPLRGRDGRGVRAPRR